MHKMDPSCGFFPVNVKWTSTLKTNCCFFKMPFQKNKVQINTSSPAYVFFTKTVRQICSKSTGGYPCRSDFLLLQGCSPINLLHICRMPLLKKTSGRLLLK